MELTTVLLLFCGAVLFTAFGYYGAFGYFTQKAAKLLIEIETLEEQFTRKATQLVGEVEALEKEISELQRTREALIETTRRAADST